MYTCFLRSHSDIEGDTIPLRNCAQMFTALGESDSTEPALPVQDQLRGRLYG